MRRSSPLLVLLLASACSQAGDPAGDRGGQDLKTYDVQESAAPSPVQVPQTRDSRAAGPDISPTAAPGVAFNYRYAFRLPTDRVAQVQEQHAQTCESLGPRRCRITGMLYRVVNETDVEAMLAFRLDPAIARRFGRAGVEAVTRAEGMLTESEITGTDVGTEIRRAGRDIAELNEELRRIEARLAQGGLPAAERQRLEAEAQELRRAIQAIQANREEAEETLATTPMVFNYGSGDLVPGPRGRPSLSGALDQALSNFLQGGTVLLIILITLLPWALAIGLIWWIVRRIVVWRRRSTAPAGPAESSAATT
ncbi:MAG: DUF4349 domain-containing protein [Sphingosinicella sp.]|uniref:DUF4349 domain-containing protein n=1 Tax=Sphingosinicella sp. TaxID=1917971 RepID=UPI00403832D7